MTKAEIKAIASKPELMDILNTISGLMEINSPSDQALINSLIDDIYHKVAEEPHPTRETTRARMLYYFMEHDPEMHKKLKNKRWAEIRWEYLKLTNTDKQ